MAHVTETDQWPGFAEELGRKALETLEKWLEKHQAGKITVRELFILIDGLYDATSGLAPKEVSDVLADIHKEIRTNGKAA